MQHAKIQQYCEGIIEAGWLAALIIAPLFFNTYSSRVFEPDKISLIRSISLVMLLAYLVKIIDGGRLWLPGGGVTPVARSHNPPPSDQLQAGMALTPANLWKLPLLLPVLLLAASYALSTLLSISPLLKLVGFISPIARHLHLFQLSDHRPPHHSTSEATGPVAASSTYDNHHQLAHRYLWRVPAL